jgi:hypothetical protein
MWIRLQQISLSVKYDLQGLLYWRCLSKTNLSERPYVRVSDCRTYSIGESMSESARQNQNILYNC